MDKAGPLVIETHGLTKHYGQVQALSGLSLQVSPHSIFAFLGPNGAGKTTAIKLLLGLARPTSGSGRIFGHDIMQESMAIRKRTGYLAQDPRYYEHLTARETLRFTANFFFTGPRDLIEERIQETLTLVGLEGKADRPIRGFSGGERQRLGIAQAQVNYPDLLILDEPAASLDPGGRRDVLEVMERLRRHTTIFYSTHILADVQRVSATVAILNRGQLIAQAPIEQLLAGSGGVVFHLKLRGEPGRVSYEVRTRPWVTDLQEQLADGYSSWQVAVNDEAAAEEELLRIVLSDPAVRVAEFGRMKYELEDIFLDMVGEGKNGR
jgi:ABC-2 type transport system ATP-binding protein